MHVTRAPEDGVMGGDAPCVLHHRMEMSASSRRWLVHGWAGRKHSSDTTQTLQCSQNPLSQAWDGNTDKNTQHSRAGRISSPQRHVNRAGATIFFSHKIPQKGIDQDVCHSKDSFCFVFFSFLFHVNLSQQHYHLRHFRERKQWSPKDKNHPLAGRAGSRIWKTKLHQ